MYIKDKILDQKANYTNIARFISFAPGLPLQRRYAWLECAEEKNDTLKLNGKQSQMQIIALLQLAHDGVNIRSFLPEQPRGNPFIYGLKSSREVMKHLKQLAQNGYYTIVNETIPVDDGGVSGVMLGDLMEFAPDDTPKCVDKPDVCTLPTTMGKQILETVYRFNLDLETYAPETRVEFSIHPVRRGIHKRHTIIWETETVLEEALPEKPAIRWPNRFSAFVGDKVFGLLVADALGFPVPRTTVVSGRIAPFVFGRHTGCREIWMRTCPTQRAPGKYPTTLGWQDPFALVAQWNKYADKADPPIVSVMAQQSVDPKWSGSLIATENDHPIVEGVQGRGDDFMIGKQAPQDLPSDVHGQVLALFAKAFRTLGPIEIEWVFDGRKVWVVQLHVSTAVCDPTMIVRGNPTHWVAFSVAKGLDPLKDLIDSVRGNDTGIELKGRVGITSHFGDLLRTANIPSRLIPD